MAHEHDHAAAFARPESGGAFVEDAHLVGRERAGLGKTDEFKRVKAQVNAAGNRDIEIARRERGTGVGNGEQRTGARAVHGVAAAFQIKLIADAPGDGVREAARKRFLADGRKR